MTSSRYSEQMLTKTVIILAFRYAELDCFIFIIGSYAERTYSLLILNETWQFPKLFIVLKHGLEVLLGWALPVLEDGPIAVEGLLLVLFAAECLHDCE